MNRFSWIILALVVMIPGAAGLCWGHFQKRAETERIAQAAKAVADAPSADEYLALYNQWSQLTPTQKFENPWGQGQYGGPEIQRRLRQDQELRLEADLPDLDAGVKSYPSLLAEVLYGERWQDYLAEYQNRRETRALVAIASVIILAAAGLLFFAGVVKFYVLHYLHKEQEPQQQETPPARPRTKSEKRIESADTESQDGGKELKECDLLDDSEETESRPTCNPGYFESVMTRQRRPEPSGTPYIMPVSEPAAAVNAASVIKPSLPADKSSYFGWAMDSEEADTAVTTLMTTHPVTSGLSELTEEVSAIRQFAAAQQDQMRKLQDGYDWMIIRRFCMRIIRCIDNLDDRLAKLGSDDDVLRGCLEDIRDELIFSLESSGVEQYKPDLHISFKGLEKYAEALHQRIPAPDPSLAGAIAEILRPGYQYLISDDDVKIVRCAQVKLYDSVETEA